MQNEYRTRNSNRLPSFRHRVRPSAGPMTGSAASPEPITTNRTYGFRARHLAVAPRNDPADMIGFIESIY